MAKNKKNIQTEVKEEPPKRIPTASYREMPISGPIPVRPAASHVQLTPIVQPIAFVPYTSQKQPLYMLDDENMQEPMADDDGYIDESSYAEAAPTKAKRSLGLASILLLILTNLYIGVMVVGKFITGLAEITAVLKEKLIGYAIVESFIKELDFSNFSFDMLTTGNNLIALLLIGAAIFVVLTNVLSLFRLFKRGTALVTKITAALVAALTVAACVVCVISSDFDSGLGIYILTGIAVLIAFVAIIAKSRK